MRPSFCSAVLHVFSCLHCCSWHAPTWIKAKCPSRGPDQRCGGDVPKVTCASQSVLRQRIPCLLM